MALTYVKSSGIDVTGSYTVNNMTATSNVTASYFVGNGSQLTSVSAATAATVTANAQPNITSVGTLSALTITGITTATGGVKTANIIDTAGTVTIQTKYNSVSGDAGIVGNLTVGTGGSGNVTASYFIGNGSQLTGLPSSYANSNVAAYLPTYTGNVAANFFIGNGSLLTNINGSNVDGQVGNSLVSGTVYTAAQPNITSVGTLTSLAVTNDVTIGGNLTISGTTTTVDSTTVNIKDINIVLANNATSAAQANGGGITINGANATILYNSTTNAFTFSHTLSANGALLSNITGSNVSGQVSNALVAGTVYTNAQPNITSVGSLASLTVTGITTATGGVKTGAISDTSGTSTIQIKYGSLAGDVGITGNLTVGTGGTGNIAATAVLTDNLKYANGNPWSFGGGTPGGSNTQLQYNNNGTFSGIANVTFDGANLSLGNISNVKITGGSTGQIIQTDGTGNLSWVTPTGGTITVDNFTGNGVQANYTLSSTPADKNSTIITVGGVSQPRNTYYLYGNVIAFTSPPPDTAPIEVTTFNSAMGYGGSGYGGSVWTVNGQQGNVTTEATFYTVTQNSNTNYIIGGNSNPNISLVKGRTYRFQVSASGNPFWIMTSNAAYNASNVYSTGVYNNGTDISAIYFTVPETAPSTLYYVSQNHSSMVGNINIVELIANNNIDANVLYANSVVNKGSGTPTITSATNIELQANSVVRITSSPFQLYNCTTTVRDTLTPSNGFMIYNTTTNKFQGYANGVWADLN